MCPRTSLRLLNISQTLLLADGAEHNVHLSRGKIDKHQSWLTRTSSRLRPFVSGSKLARPGQTMMHLRMMTLTMKTLPCPRSATVVWHENGSGTKKLTLMVANIKNNFQPNAVTASGVIFEMTKSAAPVSADREVACLTTY